MNSKVNPLEWSPVVLGLLSYLVLVGLLQLPPTWSNNPVPYLVMFAAPLATIGVAVRNLWRVKKVAESSVGLLLAFGFLLLLVLALGAH